MAGAKKPSYNGSKGPAEGQPTTTTPEIKASGAAADEQVEKHRVMLEKGTRQRQMADLMAGLAAADVPDTTVKEDSPAATKSCPSPEEASKKSVGEASTVRLAAEAKSTNDNEVETTMGVVSQAMSERLDEIIDLQEKNVDLQKTIKALERTIAAHKMTIKDKDERIGKFKGNESILEKALYEARAGERGATNHLGELRSEVADLKHSFSRLKRELTEHVDMLRNSFAELAQAIRDDASD